MQLNRGESAISHPRLHSSGPSSVVRHSFVNSIYLDICFEVLSSLLRPLNLESGIQRWSNLLFGHTLNVFSCLRLVVLEVLVSPAFSNVSLLDGSGYFIAFA